MASYEKAIERWLALERGERPGRGGYLVNHRMPMRPGRIDSYGAHFTLAETIRDRKRRIRCFLLNGDRSTVTTTGKHMPVVRGALQASGIQCIVIPFSALRAAGIDRATIRPIAVNNDRMETIYEKLDPINIDAIEWGEITLPTEGGVVVVDGRVTSDPKGGARFQNGHLPGRPEITISRCVRGYDYTIKQYVDYNDPSPRLYTENGTGIEHDDEHGWHVKHYKHWLGESVFRARVGRAWRTYVSSFDYQERIPLYFLAELPRGAKPRTVEDAILALSPRIVHAAVAQGREVKRQGDMFAIPTSLSTRVLKRRAGRPIERMSGVFGTDHVVTEQIVGEKGVTYARGTIHHRPGLMADHKRVKLGNVWHLIVPNTVPRRQGAMVRMSR